MKDWEGFEARYSHFVGDDCDGGHREDAGDDEGLLRAEREGMSGGDARPDGTDFALVNRTQRAAARRGRQLWAVRMYADIFTVTDESSDGQRYFLRRGGDPECEVTFDDWVMAERMAGFVNTMGCPDEPGTGGFSGRDISGRIQRRPPRSSEPSAVPSGTPSTPGTPSRSDANTSPSSSSPREVGKSE